MADWYGAARTNYVRFTDKEELKKRLASVPLEIVEKESMEGKIAFFPANSDNGGFPSTYLEEDDEEVDFDWTSICDLLPDGEVLIVMEGGAEKLRYITGYADAYTNQGFLCGLNINDIYELAAKKASLPKDSISLCEY